MILSKIKKGLTGRVQSLSATINALISPIATIALTYFGNGEKVTWVYLDTGIFIGVLSIYLMSCHFLEDK